MHGNEIDLIWNVFPFNEMIHLDEFGLLVEIRNLFACKLVSRTGLRRMLAGAEYTGPVGVKILSNTVPQFPIPASAVPVSAVR